MNPLRWFRRDKPAAPSKPHRFGHFVIPEGTVVSFAENVKEMYGGKVEPDGVWPAEEWERAKRVE